MINMTHRPHIHMRLRTLKLRLRHGVGSSCDDDLSSCVAAGGLEPPTSRL
jgi:hypothetical protein